MSNQPQEHPLQRLHAPQAESGGPNVSTDGHSQENTLANEPEPVSRGSLAAAFSALNFAKYRENEAKSSDPPRFFHREFTKPFQRNKDKGGDRREDNDSENNQQRVGLRLLHSCSEPLIDLIFVHGLKGHPVKTWRESGKPHSLWPQNWLPRDPEFQHVNIHTFGYEAEVARGSSILNIADFGQTLMEEMRNSSYLRHNENVRSINAL